VRLNENSNVNHEIQIRRLHAARQLPSWLTFDIGAKGMSDAPHIELRDATQHDVPFLKELRRTTMQRVIENHYPWKEEAQHERVLAHFECAKLVRIDGRNVGLLKVVYSDSEVLLSQIQLLPEWQRKKVGTTLITKLQGECATTNRSLSLHVMRSNPAIGLYRKLGFEIESSDVHSHTMRWRSEKRPNQSVEPTRT
jgi:ribosomal protein S18 acetylase RimI-like enzyme